MCAEPVLCPAGGSLHRTRRGSAGAQSLHWAAPHWALAGGKGRGGSPLARLPCALEGPSPGKHRTDPALSKAPQAEGGLRLGCEVPQVQVGQVAKVGSIPHTDDVQGSLGAPQGSCVPVTQ